MRRLHWIVAAVALQLAVLGAEYLGSVWPLWTGEHVQLEIVPVDPRSMFRGNYARLDYSVGTLPSGLYEGPREPLRAGEIVYVSLSEDNPGWKASRIGLTAPERGIFLRGRLTRRWDPSQPTLGVRYGIEAWFAPRERALEIERSLPRWGRRNESATAEVAVSDSGRAALVALHLP